MNLKNKNTLGVMSPEVLADAKKTINENNIKKKLTGDYKKDLLLISDHNEDTKED